MPNPIVVDSGPCIALFDRDDEFHEQAIDFVERTAVPLLTNLAVVTEVMFLLDFKRQAQHDFLSWLRIGAVTLIEPDADDLARTSNLMAKYADLPMDFTDGLIVAMCERLELKDIASVDKHFLIYRYKGRGRFNNVFFENA